MFDNLVAICGVSCTLCEVYTVTVNNDRAGIEKIAREWTENFGRSFTIDDIACDGCRVPDGRRSAYCATCEILLCAREKGHETCAHCPESPCDRIVAPVARDAIAELKKSL